MYIKCLIIVDMDLNDDQILNEAEHDRLIDRLHELGINALIPEGRIGR